MLERYEQIKQDLMGVNGATETYCQAGNIENFDICVHDWIFNPYSKKQVYRLVGTITLTANHITRRVSLRWSMPTDGNIYHHGVAVRKLLLSKFAPFQSIQRLLEHKRFIAASSC